MPVPLLEAFALPIPVERATTQRPHANMYVITMPDALSIMHPTRIYISTIGIYRCCNHDRDFESCEVSSSQERASSKRFPIITHPPAQPISGLCGRYAPAKLVKKFISPTKTPKKIIINDSRHTTCRQISPHGKAIQSPAPTNRS